jgi:hypothetical protein
MTRSEKELLKRCLRVLAWRTLKGIAFLISTGLIAFVTFHVFALR